MCRTFFAFTLMLICGLVAAAQQANPQCPTILITGPGEVTNPGEVMVFTAKPTRDLPVGVGFRWTVSSGTIESGQGTGTISVRVPTDPNYWSVTATVKVAGLPSTCFTTSSEIAPIAVLPIGEPVDRYGKLSLYDEYARVNIGVTAAINNPTCLLVIIREAPRFRSTDQTHIKKIKDFITRRLHFPFRRLVIVTKIGPQIQNAIWLVPPGAKMPD
jgi:hypothetical protein